MLHAVIPSRPQASRHRATSGAARDRTIGPAGGQTMPESEPCGGRCVCPRLLVCSARGAGRRDAAAGRGLRTGSRHLRGLPRQRRRSSVGSGTEGGSGLLAWGRAAARLADGARAVPAGARERDSGRPACRGLAGNGPAHISGRACGSASLPAVVAQKPILTCSRWRKLSSPECPKPCLDDLGGAIRIRTPGPPAHCWQWLTRPVRGSVPGVSPPAEVSMSRVKRNHQADMAANGGWDRAPGGGSGEAGYGSSATGCQERRGSCAAPRAQNARLGGAASRARGAGPARQRRTQGLGPCCPRPRGGSSRRSHGAGPGASWPASRCSRLPPARQRLLSATAGSRRSRPRRPGRARAS